MPLTPRKLRWALLYRYLFGWCAGEHRKTSGAELLRLELVAIPATNIASLLAPWSRSG